MSTDAEYSDVELLSMALLEAVEARQAGVIVGPVVDEVALRRARRVDAARSLLDSADCDGAA